MMSEERNFASGFGGLNAMREAMRKKDPELARRVGAMNIRDAWRAWKEVHPEDFPNGGMSIPGSDCIVPKSP